jgi:6-phosphogluconolactonase
MVMKHLTILNRRNFVQLMGSVSLGSVASRASWLAAETSPVRHAYVGQKNSIQVFAVNGSRWTPTQTVASVSPAFLALDPTQRFLFAVNDKNTHEGLPTGTIEAYAVDSHDGRLTLINRQPLSLSGVRPRHLAISPDGRKVVVAIDGGGAYNVLPVGEDGRLGRVSGILKETGSGPNREHQDAAHPQMVMFDGTGQHVLSVDMGSDRVSVFKLGTEGFVAHHSSLMEAGAGPRQMAMHPEGRLLFVANELNASLACYDYDASQGKIVGRLQQVSMPRKDVSRQQGAGSLLMHPSGRFLYTLGGGSPDRITAWRVDAVTGSMRRVHSRGGVGSVQGMTMVADGSALLAMGQGASGISRLAIDSPSGHLGEPVKLASVAAPISLAVKYL